MADEEGAKKFFALGSQARKAGDDAGACEHFAQGLKACSSVELKSAFLVSRSGALVGLGRMAEALVDAEECQKLRPSWARSFECKAAALDGLGRTEEAAVSRRLAAALAALKQDPKNEVAQSFLAADSAARGDAFVATKAKAAATPLQGLPRFVGIMLIQSCSSRL
jgi:stress-induced-phosphoprotein 1